MRRTIALGYLAVGRSGMMISRKFFLWGSAAYEWYGSMPSMAEGPRSQIFFHQISRLTLTEIVRLFPNDAEPLTDIESVCGDIIGRYTEKACTDTTRVEEYQKG